MSTVGEPEGTAGGCLSTLLHRRRRRVGEPGHVTDPSEDPLPKALQVPVTEKGPPRW